MAKKEKNPTKKHRKTYKVKNWKEYNESLKQRGSIEIWIDEDITEKWEDQRPNQHGSQYIYSDEAIEIVLTLRTCFHLPLRATAGFVGSLFSLMKIDLPVPNYSTLCRRSQKLNIELDAIKGKKIKAIIVDATGLKLYGEGEWKVRKHGYSKHRTWRKLHVGIEPNSQAIVTQRLTTNGISDSEAGQKMMEAVGDDLESITGDGGYDKRAFYNICIKKGVKNVVIPPQKNAKIWQHGNQKAPPHPRDQNLRYIREHGRKKWKREHQYHKRSLIETTMFRLKTILGGELKSRKMSSQETEVAIKCKILNTYTAIGMPESYEVKTA